MRPAAKTVQKNPYSQSIQGMLMFASARECGGNVSASPLGQVRRTMPDCSGGTIAGGIRAASNPRKINLSPGIVEFLQQLNTRSLGFHGSNRRPGWPILPKNIDFRS